MKFQSTQPKRAATPYWQTMENELVISIHAAQEGCDQPEDNPPGVEGEFQSTQPKRAATSCRGFYTSNYKYFNPRSPRGLRQILPAALRYRYAISIHAAQEGCDSDWPCYTLPFYRISIHAAQEGCDSGGGVKNRVIEIISIHAAQEGCDVIGSAIHALTVLFQSTQPKRAATIIYSFSSCI